jgi:hypothetical protein
MLEMFFLLVEYQRAQWFATLSLSLAMVANWGALQGLTQRLLVTLPKAQ